MTKRKNHAPLFKAKVALAALSCEKTLSELSFDFGIHQTLIRNWVKQYIIAWKESGLSQAEFCRQAV